MDIEIIDMSDEQLADVQARLDRYDKSHIAYSLSGSAHIGIMRDGQLIAGASGCMTAYRIFYVSTVYVDENHRREGLGRKLMDCMEKRAVSLGANLIRLDTFSWQGADFYRKLGYDQVGHYESLADGFCEYFFLKRL